MGYIKAEEVLPTELVELIQEYAEGQMLYIPRKGDKKTAWGTKTGTRELLFKRNEQIYAEYLSGIKVAELSEKYYLTEKSIQRIIRDMVKVQNQSEK